MVAQTLEAFGSSDILINNAGLDPRDKWYETTSENWDRVQEVTVKGYFLCAKHVAAPMMKQQWGRKSDNS
jgi:3-oxoacyl-[acyl-carrier protein] reductase